MIRKSTTFMTIWYNTTTKASTNLDIVWTHCVLAVLIPKLFSFFYTASFSMHNLKPSRMTWWTFTDPLCSWVKTATQYNAMWKWYFWQKVFSNILICTLKFINGSHILDKSFFWITSTLLDLLIPRLISIFLQSLYFKQDNYYLGRGFIGSK